MKLELLRIDQYKEVHEIYLEQCGELPPNNTISIAIIKDDNDKIIGTCALEIIPVINKLWVDPRYRGNGFGNKLFSKLETLLTSGYYTMPSNEYSEAVVQRQGLKKLPCQVYVKE